MPQLFSQLRLNRRPWTQWRRTWLVFRYDDQNKKLCTCIRRLYQSAILFESGFPKEKHYAGRLHKESLDKAERQVGGVQSHWKQGYESSHRKSVGIARRKWSIAEAQFDYQFVQVAHGC